MPTRLIIQQRHVQVVPKTDDNPVDHNPIFEPKIPTTHLTDDRDRILHLEKELIAAQREIEILRQENHKLSCQYNTLLSKYTNNNNNHINNHLSSQESTTRNVVVSNNVHLVPDVQQSITTSALPSIASITEPSVTTSNTDETVTSTHSAFQFYCVNKLANLKSMQPQMTHRQLKAYSRLMYSQLPIEEKLHWEEHARREKERCLHALQSNLAHRDEQKNKTIHWA